MINMKSILERPGWTRSAVARFLGEPDREQRNPVYKSAPPERLYSLTRVESAEQSPEFAEWVQRSNVRRLTAKNVADKRKQQTLDAVAAIQIAVPVLAEDLLLEYACASFNSGPGSGGASPKSDPAFLERIQVNFLRHQMTDYEALLEKQLGRVGAAEAKMMVRSKVYDAIAIQYPELAHECSKQEMARLELATACTLSGQGR